MADFSRRVTMHRRLVILKELAEDPRYQGNDSILKDVANQLGVSSTRDQVRTDIRWLAEQGLVTIDSDGPVLVAILTERGAEVASGTATVDGVQRPSPGKRR